VSLLQVCHSEGRTTVVYLASTRPCSAASKNAQNGHAHKHVLLRIEVYQQHSRSELTHKMGTFLISDVIRLPVWCAARLHRFQDTGAV
jgi:hypothetical protein